jgi:hypothetical protein
MVEVLVEVLVELRASGEVGSDAATSRRDALPPTPRPSPSPDRRNRYGSGKPPCRYHRRNDLIHRRIVGTNSATNRLQAAAIDISAR